MTRKPPMPRSVAAMSVASAVMLALSGCTTNRTPYTFYTWETSANVSGVELQALTTPLRESDGFFTRYVGWTQTSYRVINRSEETKCVRIAFEDTVGVTTTTGSLGELIPIRPGQVIEDGWVNPNRDESRWRDRLIVGPAYAVGDGYRCTRPEPEPSGDSDCFITTAMCEQTGKADDCRELELLRDYRDRVLAATPEGRRLIARYYELAPAIVAALDRDPARDAQYRALRGRYLVPAAEAVERGDHETARVLYIRMVEGLSRRYL